MWTIEPPRASSCPRAALCAIRNAPRRFVARIRSQLSSSISRNARSSAMPALLTSTSIRCQRSSAAATAPSTAAASLTSGECVHALPPAAAISCAACSSGLLRRPISITSAPSLANRSAIARPIPCPAPVTTMFRPSKRGFDTTLLSLLDGARDDAADEMTLEDQIRSDHGQRRDQQAGHQRRIVGRETALQLQHADRERLHAVALKYEEREEELVPGPQHVEDDERRERRLRERQEDSLKGAMDAGSVDPRCLDQLVRHGLEERRPQVHVEREVQCRVEEDYPPVGVQQAKLDELDVDRDHQEQGRDREPGQHEEVDRAGEAPAQLREGVARDRRWAN